MPILTPFMPPMGSDSNQLGQGFYIMILHIK